MALTSIKHTHVHEKRKKEGSPLRAGLGPRIKFLSPTNFEIEARNNMSQQTILLSSLKKTHLQAIKRQFL